MPKPGTITSVPIGVKAEKKVAVRNIFRQSLLPDYQALLIVNAAHGVIAECITLPVSSVLLRSGSLH